MIRAAHTGDIHFRPKRAGEVFASLDTLERESEEREVDLIAISGDIYDSAVFNSGSSQFPEIVERIRSLADVAPVVMVYGTPSHDIAGSLDVFEQVKSLHGIAILRPGNRYYLIEGGHVVEGTDEAYGPEQLMLFGIPEPHKGWLLAGKPAMGPEETKAAMQEGMRALLLGLAAQRKQHPDIPCLVLYHGQIRGATMDNGQVVENAIGRDDLAMIGADYYALGDIHKPQQIGDLPMYYPGSVYPTNWGETHQCGFNVVSIDNTPAPARFDGEPTTVGMFADRWVATVERVDYPHPQQLKFENVHGDNATLPDFCGKRVWSEITCTREEAASIDTEALTESLLAWGAVEGSRVTLKITATETVRAAGIESANKLIDKVNVYAENSAQDIPAGVPAKCAELEEAAAARGEHSGAWIKLRKLILRGATGIWKGQGLDEIEVDLEDFAPGLVGLLWPNGAGKTTLLENFHPWPSLVTRPGRLADHFRLRDSYRDLTWTDERSGDEYRALLQINGTSKAGEVDYLLYRNGALVDGINGRKEPYVAAIDELWGGMDLYLRSAFVSQKDAGLADSTKGERKTLMVGLSGLEYLQGYADSAKARAKLITEEIATDAGWIAATEEQLAALDDLNAAADEKRTAIRGGEEAVCKLEERGKDLKAQYDVVSAKVEMNKALLRESRDLTIRDEKLSTEASLLKRAREQWAAAVEKREHAAECIANWEELEGERKKLEAARAEKLAERNTALEAYNTRRETYDGKRRELEAAKRTAETALDTLRGERKEAMASVEMLGDLTDRPRHDTCPECGAALPWAADEAKQREEWERKLKAAQESVWELDKRIPDAEDAVEAAAKPLREIEQPERPTFGELREDSELKRITADQEYLKVAEARETVRKADEAAVRIDGIDSELVAITTERAEIDTRQGELLAAVDEELDRRYAELGTGLEQARREYAGARETLSALRAEAEAIGRQIADLELKATELAKRREKVTEKRADASEWTWLQKACGPDGIQALELDALAPSIEDVANRLLSAAYGSRFSVRFATTKMSADGKKQLEDFLIMVADNEHGDEQELSTLSGGEAVWLRRALYDAFGIVRARNTGLRFLTVFADESDGALDPEARESYFRMMMAAHDESGRHHTLVVSHGSEVQELLSQRIEPVAPQRAAEERSA